MAAISVTMHAIDRYRERVRPGALRSHAAKEIREAIEAGEVATRSVLRKSLSPASRKRLGENKLAVFNREMGIVFICAQPDDGGLVVVTLVFVRSVKRAGRMSRGHTKSHSEAKKRHA